MALGVSASLKLYSFLDYVWIGNSFGESNFLSSIRYNFDCFFWKNNCTHFVDNKLGIFWFVNEFCVIVSMCCVCTWGTRNYFVFPSQKHKVSKVVSYLYAQSTCSGLRSFFLILFIIKLTYWSLPERNIFFQTRKIPRNLESNSCSAQILAGWNNALTFFPKNC